jgi:hypothetical protein
MPSDLYKKKKKKRVLTLAWVNYLREQKLQMKFVSRACDTCATHLIVNIYTLLGTYVLIIVLV